MALIPDVPDTETSPLEEEAREPAFDINAVLKGVRRVESGDGKYLVSPAGALGPYQLGPGVVSDYGINPMEEGPSRKVAQNELEINLAKYGNLRHALMAYHAGRGNMDRYLAGKESDVGPKTLAYPDKVLAAAGIQAPAEDIAKPYLQPSTSSLASRENMFAGIFPELEKIKGAENPAVLQRENMFAGIFPEPTEKKSSEKSGFTRGFVSSLHRGVPESLAGMAEMVGLEGVSRQLRDFAESTPEDYVPRVPSITDIPGTGIGDTLSRAGTYIAEQAGSGVGSALLPLATGGLGLIGGSMVAGPLGAAAGALFGAGGSSYMLNAGDLYNALREEKVDPDRARKLALGFGVPIAGLDVASLSTIAGRFTGPAKKEAYKSLAKRITSEAGIGAVAEGGTEGVQQGIQEFVVASETGKPINWASIADSAIGGALLGAPVGAVAGIKGKKTVPQPETAEQTQEGQFLALPPPSTKYGEGFTYRGEREGEGVDIVRTPEERIEEFRRKQKAEAEAPVETPAEPRQIGVERFDEEGALRGEGFTMRGAEEDVAPAPQEEFKPAGLLGTSIRDVEPVAPREVAEIRLSELNDGDRVTKAWLSEQTGEKGKSLDSLWMDLIGDKFLRREGNKFVRNAPEEVKPQMQLPPPEAGKYGPGYRFTRRDLQPGEGLPVSEGERLKEQAEARRVAQAEARRVAEEPRALPKPVEQPTKITETKFSRGASTYYSTLEEATQKLPPSGTGQQMLASLQNIPGVKLNEIVATGLDTWLPEQRRVTREQVQEYVAQNAVEIREVTNKEGNGRAAELRRLANTRGLSAAETDELIALEKAGTADETRAPKFNGPDTTLPGGTNYREVLLTLPQQEGALDRINSDMEAVSQEYADLQKERREKLYTIATEPPEFVARVRRNRDRARALEDERSRLKGEAFRGGHFEEPNVLAHIRLNDRTDADGKRVLFVEEIQSDWHQQGRRRGYKNDENQKKAAEERKKAAAEVDAAYKALQMVKRRINEAFEAKTSEGGWTRNDKNAFAGEAKEDMRAEIAGMQDERREAYARLERADNAYSRFLNDVAVPDAPFKKDWHELAFRRVLKMAADEGYDRVAWTTGDQQNDRYDLSKQVDSIRVWSNGEGLYYWEARKDGRDLGRDGGKAIDESALADVIGKDLAKRAVDDIAAGKDANYSGIDLKVGGAGMRGFYDKMLPAYANKFGKKYGAKVGDTVITTPKPEKVHSINITPQMRDALREGIPLFSRSDRDADNPPTPSKLLRQEKISDTLITEDFENPQTREEQKVRVSRAMKDALAHVLGPGVDVRVVDQVLGKWDGKWHPAGGAFDPVEKVIALSMESPNIERTAFHEAIHFLREANVISDADWKLLSEQADKWKDKAYKSTWEKYADKKNETRTEEVIADAFSDWRNGRLDVPNPILRIFHKILDFVQRLKKKIGYEGARSWKDVFTDIESGRYRDLAGQYHLTEMAKDGSFALVDSRTARAVGNYQTKKAAITAALDIEAAQNASLRLQRESAIAVDDAATKVAAKHSVDQMIGIAQRKAMFSRMPSLESEATYLTNWWGKAILPVAMAAKDRIFARVWNVVNDRERFTSRIYQDYFSPLRGLSNLSAQEKTNVYKAAVAARMDGIDVKPSKSNVTIKYKGADDIIDHTTNKVWLKSGETISLNSKETESFFALKNAFKNVWADLNDAAAIKAGFPMDGNIKELRDAAVGDSAKKAAFLQKYKNIPGIDKILESMTAGIYQERAGYIPFQRYGSVIIAVTRKGAKKGDAPLATVLVDADSADMPSVKKARKALEDRYGAVGDVQEPRLVSENDYSGAAMEEMEHLISRLERAAGRDKGDLYKAYIEKVADEFKRGWQRKSRNVLGFSTDFEKVIPEYLSNAAQTNGRMRYANAIDRQMREINNPRGGTPADGVPSKSVRDFTNKWLNYVDNPSNDFSTTRKVGFLWYLWGNLSSAVVNLSQTPLVTLPVVAKWGMNLGQSTAEATKIANLFFSRKAWYMQDGRILLDVDKMNFLSDAERRAVKGWQQSGLLQNQITNDQAGLGYVEKISNKAVMRNIEKVFQAGASPFALAETINRLTAGLIAYRSALKTGALDKAIKVYEKNQAFQDRFDGGRTLTPEKMAAWTIEETQFFGGKVNTSEMMRGIGSVAFQFKNYTANYLNLMYRSFANEGREGKMAGLAMLAGLMLVSGLRGIPFEGDLEQLLNWITETVTGINPNINMQLKEFARKGLMGAGLPEEQAILGASLMMNGLSRLTSVDLGSRFGQGDIVPNDVNSLFGPVVSAFSVAADGISHVKNGQTFQGTARFVPKAFGNVIESLGYTDQGIKTKAGNEVMGPNEFSTADQIVKALGFQPAKLAERQELAYDLTQVSEQARKAAGGMARYLANMIVRAENARARGDMEEAEEAMQNYAERLRRYEREMSDPDRPAYMQYKINRDAIKKEIRNALDWRMRFLGGKKMARPEIIEILRRSGESIGA